MSGARSGGLAALDEPRPAGDLQLALDPDLPLIRADAAARAPRQPAGELRALLGAIRCRCARVVRASSCASSIGDRGPAPRRRVFSRFTARRAAKPPRLRLGLAIVRGFVEANGGRVWVSRCLARGELVVELPWSPRERWPGCWWWTTTPVLQALKVILREAAWTEAASAEALDRAASACPTPRSSICPPGAASALRRLREWTVPILVLSAVGGRTRRSGAQAIADDYDQALRPARSWRGSAPAAAWATPPASPRSRRQASTSTPVVSRDGRRSTSADRVDRCARRCATGAPHDSHSLLWRSEVAYGDDTQVLRAHIANLRRKISLASGATSARIRRGLRLPPRR